MMHRHLATMFAALTLVLCTVFASEAKAACFATPVKNAFAAPPAKFGGPNAGQSAFDASEPSEADDSIVGMWNAEFLIGNGPGRYDQGFQL